MKELVAGPEHAGRALASVVGEQDVLDGRVFVDGKRAKDPQLSLKLGARVVVHAPRGPRPELAPLVVLFEDAELIVLDKAAGDHLNETETNARPALVERIAGAHVVHRLDRETTGVVVLAKSARAAARLSEAFAGRAVEKEYLALAYGAVDDGEIDAPIGLDKRRPRARKVRSDGKPAQTTVVTLSRAHGVSAIRALPKTGRTHQIRVHLAHRGAPLLGDRTYGGPMFVRMGDAVVEIARTMLHARRLALPGYPAFEAPIPADMAAFRAHGLALEGGSG